MSVLSSDDRGVVLPCPSCGKANRIGFVRLGQATRCGSCRTELGAPALPVEAASAARFDRLVRQSPLPVLVDFWAEWCGPCRTVAPQIELVARRTAGRLLVVKVDTEAVPDLAARMGIVSIPTLSVFVGGREVARQPGAMGADQIEAFVRQAAPVGNRA